MDEVAHEPLPPLPSPRPTASSTEAISLSSSSSSVTRTSDLDYIMSNDTTASTSTSTSATPVSSPNVSVPSSHSSPSFVFLSTLDPSISTFSLSPSSPSLSSSSPSQHNAPPPSPQSPQSAQFHYLPVSPSTPTNTPPIISTAHVYEAPPAGYAGPSPMFGGAGSGGSTIPPQFGSGVDEWRQSVERRVRRIEELEKLVVNLRSELIDEVMRRKALESYILEKEKEIDAAIAMAQSNNNRLSRKEHRKDIVTVTVKGKPVGGGSGIGVVGGAGGVTGGSPGGPTGVLGSGAGGQSGVGVGVGGGNVGDLVLTRAGKSESSPFDDYGLPAFTEWLASNQLSSLIPLFTGESVPLPTDPNNNSDVTALGYLPMFQRAKDRFIVSLSKCNISKLLEFIFLAEDDPLTKIWDRKFFIRDFILTHQSFMKPQQLFKFLSLKCCSTGSTTSTVLLTRDFIQSLVRYLKFDVRSNEIWSNMITQLAQAIYKVNTDVSRDIMRSLENAVRVRNVMDMNTNCPSVTSTAGGSAGGGGHVLDDNTLQNFSKDYDILVLSHHAYEFATQLTLIEQKYAHNSETREYLNQAWTSDKIDTPSLDKYIEFTNRVSNFILRDILCQPMSRMQAEVITFYIDVANNLLKINNFNGLQMVLACLHSPALVRLRSAWSFAPKRAREDFDRLTALMSPQSHYKSYEDTVNANDENEVPVIPFVSVPLRDLFLVEEALHSVVTSPRGWVNFDKMTKLGKILWTFRKFQVKYTFPPIPVLQQYIEEKAEVWDNKVAYEIAKLREDHSQLEWNILPTKPTQSYHGEEVDMFHTDVLTIAEWQLLLSGTEKAETFKKGTEIIMRGTSITTIYFIESGQLTIDSISDNSERISVGTIGTHQLIGLESLLHPAGVVSTVYYHVEEGEVKVRELDLNRTKMLFTTESELFAKVNKILVGRVASLLACKRKPGSDKSAQNAVSKANNVNPIVKVKKKKGKKSQSTTTPPTTSMTTTPTPTTTTKKPKKLNFEEAFGLEREIPIKEYSCQLRKATSISGLLFITQNNLCFANNYSTVFQKQRCVVPLKSIVSISKQGKSLIIISENQINEKKTEKEELEFANFENLDEVTEFLSGYWNRKIMKTSAETNSWLLQELDWEKILLASKEAIYQKQQTVLPCNSPVRALYKVISGSCRIVKKNDEVVGELFSGDVFGILEFVLNSPVHGNCLVKAAEDNTKVYRIEGYYLDVLFSYKPDICGRFYHYLATELYRKLHGIYEEQLEKHLDGVLNMLEVS